ncbi:hypothetical protein KIN20_022552 [Parelaphostrongylus tenuis]|uniref:Uncharacterized protein n=1 Tax=Parelaphostrongylus tenuis TaxID=148309 RepID=A0AAD5MQQ9_PARTN|nr:hypothetical protein KIN20_022552 [Parelaphostrongylus tenuis]
MMDSDVFEQTPPKEQPFAEVSSTFDVPQPPNVSEEYSLKQQPFAEALGTSDGPQPLDVSEEDSSKQHLRQTPGAGWTSRSSHRHCLLACPAGNPGSIPGRCTNSGEGSAVLLRRFRRENAAAAEFDGRWEESHLTERRHVEESAVTPAVSSRDRTTICR